MTIRIADLHYSDGIYKYFDAHFGDYKEHYSSENEGWFCTFTVHTPFEHQLVNNWCRLHLRSVRIYQSFGTENTVIPIRMTDENDATFLKYYWRSHFELQT